MYVAREVCKGIDNTAFQILLQNRKEFKLQNTLLTCITILHASLLLTLVSLKAPIYKRGNYINPQGCDEKAGN